MDVIDRLNDHFRHYFNNQNAVPNVYELITILCDCAFVKSSNKRELHELISKVVKYDKSQLEKHLGSNFLFNIIEWYRVYALIGFEHKEDEKKLSATLADIACYIANGNSYSSVDQFIDLKVQVKEYEKEHKMLLLSMSELLKYIEDNYDPYGKMSDFNKEKTDENNNGRDPNVHEALALITSATFSGGITGEKAELLKNYAENIIKRMLTNHIISDENDPLIEAINGVKNMALTGHRFEPIVAKYISKVSGIYFYLKQKDRDDGKETVFDNSTEFSELEKLKEEVLSSMKDQSKLCLPLELMFEFISNRYEKTKEVKETNQHIIEKKPEQ